MARKLKVFEAQFGFFDTVVAAPSQVAALRAWGANRNLFHDGQARVASDPKAIDTALAQPGVPLRRATGSNDVFSLEPRLPKLPDLPDRKLQPAKVRPDTSKRRASTPAKTTVAPAPKLRPPDRSALDAAEAAVRRLAEERDREALAFKERRDALAAEESAASARHADAEAAVQSELKREKRAFDEASRRFARDR